MHVHVPPDGGAASARSRCRRIPRRLRRRAGLRPAAAHDGSPARRTTRSITFRASSITGASCPNRRPAPARPSRGRSTPAASRSRTTSGATRCSADVLAGGAPGLYRVRRAHSRPAAGVDRHSDGRPAAAAGRPAGRPARAGDPQHRRAHDVRPLRADHRPRVRRRRARGRPLDTSYARSRARASSSALERRGPFNFSAKINAGAAAASGEHLLLFNDDLEVIDAGLADGDARVFAGAGDWRGRRQAALSGRPAAAHRHGARRRRHRRARLSISIPGVSPGYAGSALIVAQLLGRHRRLPDDAARASSSRSVGSTSAFPIDFNDVDYCLRARAAPATASSTRRGRSCYHHESASFGARRQDSDADGGDAAALGAVIDNDPYLQSEPDPRLSRLSARCLT